MGAAQIFTVFAGILALVGAYFYFFGIDPETKRELERKALKTMGENKMSYMAKDQIDKIPASDQKDIKDLKKGLGNAVGGITNNPIGEQGARAATDVWDTAASYSKSAAPRVNWDTMHGHSKSAFESVSSLATKTKDGTEGQTRKAE